MEIALNGPVSGGGASYAFDIFEIHVYDTTTGRLVHRKARREVQGFCAPYKHTGGSISKVVWTRPHTLQVYWSDGMADVNTMESDCSAFHFTPSTWGKQGFDRRW